MAMKSTPFCLTCVFADNCIAKLKAEITMIQWTGTCPLSVVMKRMNVLPLIFLGFCRWTAGVWRQILFFLLHFVHLCTKICNQSIVSCFLESTMSCRYAQAVNRQATPRFSTLHAVTLKNWEWLGDEATLGVDLYWRRSEVPVLLGYLLNIIDLVVYYSIFTSTEK